MIANPYRNGRHGRWIPVRIQCWLCYSSLAKVSACPHEGALSGRMDTCLLVEDDELVGQLLQFLLQREGLEVRWARDGLEARSFLDTCEPPDLAVLDVMVPHVSGLELLQELRARAETRALPILMLTSRGGSEDVARALDLGASDYLVKPFQPEDLSARLRSLRHVR